MDENNQEMQNAPAAAPQAQNASASAPETQIESVSTAGSGLNAEKIFWGLCILLIAGFFLFFAFGGLVAPVNAASQNGAVQPYKAAPYAGAQPSARQQQAAAPAGGQLAPANNGVQEVTLTVQGGTYYPNPIRVKKGVPVKITADLGSVRGCASGIVMPDFGIRKNVRAGDNTIEFTPDKSGTFDFSCSMGMYRGQIVVEDADGTVANFKGTAPAIKASCGANGGGCGCGG